MPAIEVSRPSMAVDSDSPVHKNRASRYSRFLSDDDGNPMGGQCSGEGFGITWQNGVQEPNGAIIEDVLAAVVDRLHFFQGQLPEQLLDIGGLKTRDPEAGKFACRENALAITHIEEAIHWLNHRTLERRRRGVEGSYKP